MDHNPAQEINPHIPAAARWIGATPLVVFLAVYLLTSLILRDFYAMPITVAFLVSSVYAVAITRGLSTEKRVLRFSRGVADYNLLMMIWIFVLAGGGREEDPGAPLGATGPGNARSAEHDTEEKEQT